MTLDLYFERHWFSLSPTWLHFHNFKGKSNSIKKTTGDLVVKHVKPEEVNILVKSDSVIPKIDNPNSNTVSDIMI